MWLSLLSRSCAIEYDLNVLRRKRACCPSLSSSEEYIKSARVLICHHCRNHQALFQELQAILSPPVQPYAPVRGRSNIVMFVGLQGAGKTTTCTKYANYWKKKGEIRVTNTTDRRVQLCTYDCLMCMRAGWSVALICCDTFRAGAFDQLKQNAARIKVPFYGR